MKVTKRNAKEFEIETPSVQKVVLSKEQVEAEIASMVEKEAEYDKQLTDITNAQKVVSDHKKDMQDILKEMKKL